MKVTQEVKSFFADVLAELARRRTRRISFTIYGGEHSCDVELTVTSINGVPTGLKEHGAEEDTLLN